MLDTEHLSLLERSNTDSIKLQILLEQFLAEESKATVV